MRLCSNFLGSLLFAIIFSFTNTHAMQAEFKVDTSQLDDFTKLINIVLSNCLKSGYSQVNLEKCRVRDRLKAALSDTSISCGELCRLLFYAVLADNPFIVSLLIKDMDIEKLFCVDIDTKKWVCIDETIKKTLEEGFSKAYNLAVSENRKFIIPFFEKLPF
jgi:hypothetical protein